MANLNIYLVNFLLSTVQYNIVNCILYPYESETREVKPLDGLWKFKISPTDDQDAGFRNAWYEQDFTLLGDYVDMPVPASYNDITTNSTIRDHIGWVWYQRTVYIPASWEMKHIYLHFGSVHYVAKVWLDGEEVGGHEGGHLPFEIGLPPSLLKYGGANTLVVASNSTLTNHTIPQGFFRHTNDTYRYPPGYTTYSHDFDYFDYAGINREVLLYAVPKKCIQDIVVRTDFEHELGVVEYDVTISRKRIGYKNEKPNEGECLIGLVDPTGQTVAKSTSCSGKLFVHNVQLWWPVNIPKKVPGRLYTLEVVYNSGPDVYRLPVGIRTVKINGTKLLINGQPVYLRGFGMHEDSDVRGRGFDWSMLVRDFALIDWTKANAIRTSHYPYSSQFLQLADRTGLMVILESPACSLSNFDDEILKRHMTVMREIIARDKNHPSVIMWSLANEPLSNKPQADNYFRKLSESVRRLDQTRPVTFVTSQQISNEKAVQHMDIVCLNRYSGWYQDGGKPDLIAYQLTKELTAWYQNYSKPVMMTEYGAGSISTYKSLPETMWTESYQIGILLKHFETFDLLREKNEFLVGEMVWNLIDFNTPEEYIRPGRCVKGLFTRQREPKMAAYIIQNRYIHLMKSENNTIECNNTLNDVEYEPLVSSSAIRKQFQPPIEFYLLFLYFYQCLRN